jgi:hypothetical protein
MLARSGQCMLAHRGLQTTAEEGQRRGLQQHLLRHAARHGGASYVSAARTYAQVLDLCSLREGTFVREGTERHPLLLVPLMRTRGHRLRRPPSRRTLLALATGVSLLFRPLRRDKKPKSTRRMCRCLTAFPQSGASDSSPSSSSSLTVQSERCTQPGAVPSPTWRGLLPPCVSTRSTAVGSGPAWSQRVLEGSAARSRARLTHAGTWRSCQQQVVCSSKGGRYLTLRRVATATPFTDCDA